MKEPFLQEGDERIFTLQDVKDLFFSLRKKILLVTLAGALFAGTFAWTKSPPKYKITATFKEEAEKRDSEAFLEKMIGGVAGGQAQAIVLMKSDQVLKPLVEEMGLAASVSRSGFISKVYRRLRDNWLAERGRPLQDLQLFQFRDVRYEGEVSANYWLCFQDSCHFSVLDGDNKVLATGELGQAVRVPGCQFTVVSVPQILKVKKNYCLSISPWTQAVQALRSRLQIASGKLNQSIYNLTLYDRNRHQGTAILNELMTQYQHYLKKEHDQISIEQLTYLSSKQEQIFQRLAQTFDAYAGHFSRGLKDKGLMGWGHESLQPLQRMMEKVVAIEVELAQLEGIGKGDKIKSICNDSPITDKLTPIFTQITNLEEQRDLLQLSLQSRSLAGDAQLELRQQELNVLRIRKEETNQLLAAMDKMDPIVQEFSFESERTLALWANHMDRSDKQRTQDLVEHIDTHRRLLALQEKMVQETFFYNEDFSGQLASLDQATIQEMTVGYLKELDRIQTKKNYHVQLQGELHREDFELSALSAILHDPLSQELIKSASLLVIRLKDEKHHTEKESERWKEELHLQKKVLQEHLRQLEKVNQLEMDLIEKRVVQLQQKSLNSIQTQLSILSELVKESYHTYKESLFQERNVLEGLLADWCEKASLTIPEKWRDEQWLKMRTALETKIMETLTQLVESKSISHHLHHVQSRPLDIAQVPYIPEKPNFFSLGFFGGLGCGFIFFLWQLIRRILQGFPSSLSKLQALRYPVLGEISGRLETEEQTTGPDLEILRCMGLFLEERKGESTFVGLFAGQGPDYSVALAKNLARRGIRPLIVRCDFPPKFSDADLPGLVQLWKGEMDEVPVQSHPDFDLLPSGGFTPFSAEVLQSERLRKKMSTLKEKYPLVIGLFRAPFNSAESIAALGLCDRVLVTVNGEPTEQLTLLARWAYDEKGQNRLAFVVNK